MGFAPFGPELFLLSNQHRSTHICVHKIQMETLAQAQCRHLDYSGTPNEPRMGNVNMVSWMKRLIGDT